MQRQHDMGGMKAGPVETADHAAEPWAKLVTSLRAAMGDHDLMRVDELRRALEELPPETYAQDYFERWSEAMVDLMEEKGLMTRAEILARMDEIKSRLEGSK